MDIHKYGISLYKFRVAKIAFSLEKSPKNQNCGLKNKIWFLKEFFFVARHIKIVEQNKMIIASEK